MKKKIRLRPNQSEEVSDIDPNEMLESTTSAEPDRNLQMKKGGVIPLYKMAGGGPLFVNSQSSNIVDITTQNTARRQKQAAQPKENEPDQLTGLNWVRGDIVNAQNRVGGANKVLSEAILKYGGDTRAAIQDPYVKQAMAAATPDALEIKLKNRRRDVYDTYRTYIDQADDAKGSQLDIGEIENQYIKTGKIIPMTVSQTFGAYEDTPMDQLNNDGIGSSWHNMGKVVGTAKDMRAEINELLSPGDNQLRTTTKNGIAQGLVAIASSLGDNVLEQFKQVSSSHSSDEENIRWIASNLAAKSSPALEDSFKQAYLNTHADKDGQPVMYMDKDGMPTDDYKKFKAAFLEREIKGRISNTDSYSEQYSNARNIAWANGHKVDEEGTSPWYKLYDKQDREAVQQAITVPVQQGSDVVKQQITVPSYPLTDTHYKTLNDKVGKKATDAFGGIFRSVNGNYFSLPSTLEAGIVVGFGDSFTKLPKPTYNANGAIDVDKAVVYNPATKTYKYNDASDKLPYLTVQVLMTANDIEALDAKGGGDYLVDGKHPDKLKKVAYGDKASGGESRLFGNTDIRHEQFGTSDIDNATFKEMLKDHPELYSRLSNLGMAKDLHVVTLMTPLSESYAHEDKSKMTTPYVDDQTGMRKGVTQAAQNSRIQ